MKKKIITYYILILVLIIIAILFTLINNYVWGFDSLLGGDEFRHINRARMIYNNNINIFVKYDDPEIMELYPPGLHCFYVTFWSVTHIMNPFYYQKIIKIIFFIITLLIYFIIGNKISTKFGIFSMYSRLTFFTIKTYLPIKYTTIYTYLSAFSTQMITEITTLLLFLLLLKTLSSKKPSKLHNYCFLLFIILYTHGISHLSTYVGLFFNLITFIIIILSINIFLKNVVYSKTKILKLIIVINFTNIIVYFSYYYRVIRILNNKQNFNMSKYLPDVITNFNPNVLLSLIIIISIFLIILSIFFLKIIKQRENSLSLKSKKMRIIILIYVISQIYIMMISTLNPMNFLYGTALSGSFSYYLIPQGNIISILSILAGIVLFIVSINGLLFLSRNGNKEKTAILLLFYSIYISWFFFFVIIKYYPNRFGYVSYILPFIIAGAFLYINKLKNKVTIYKTNSVDIKYIKKTTIIFLIIFFLIIPIITEANKEPGLRDNNQATNLIRFGTSSAPIVTSDLIMILDSYKIDGQYILSSALTMEAIGVVIPIKYPKKSYEHYEGSNLKYTYYKNALQGDKEGLNNFKECYNVTYLVIGSLDVSDKLINYKKYEQNINSISIYKNSNNERIYQV